MDGHGVRPPTVFIAGEAYWIKVEADAALDLYGADVTTVELQLEPGFNFVGGPVSMVEASTVLSGYPVVATWGGDGYVSSASFEPGVGYCVLVTMSSTVTLP